MTQATSETSISTSDVQTSWPRISAGKSTFTGLPEDQDLYIAGLTSLSTVGLMLGSGGSLRRRVP